MLLTSNLTITLSNAYYSKSGKKKLDQASFLVKVLLDKVKYEGKECFVFGRKSTEYFDLRTLVGKKLKLFERREQEVCQGNS